jgi:membrane-bound ClpP family serine protease|tara:strand:+ start:1763 stop:1990 length:228 start_codon:yes stop_codon:yes gene_type:complete
MAFLDFYTIDLTIILIILLIMGILFASINYVDPEEDTVGTLGKILISFTLGFLSSVFYSYITLESDVLLKENFWD